MSASNAKKRTTPGILASALAVPLRGRLLQVSGANALAAVLLAALVAANPGTANAASQPPVPLAAADPAPLTLEQLEEVALRHNPTIVQAAMRVRAARAQWVQTGLPPNPTIGYSGEEIGADGRAGQQGAFVSQEIVTGGKLRLNRAVASHETQQAQDAWEAQRHRVLNDVRAGFCEVLAAQREVALSGQLLEIATGAAKAAEMLVQNKEASRVDLLLARVEADSVRLQLQTAQNRHLAAWRRLAATLGTSDMGYPTLAGDLDSGWPDLNWEATVQRLLSDSPQLAQARSGVARARCFLSRQCAERVPNLEFRVGLAHDNASGKDITNAELGLPLPLLNRNQGNIARAHAELAAAEAEVRRVELALQERLAVRFQQYATARQQVERYRSDILPNARESLELVRQGYRLGEFNYQALLLAQRTYFQTNLAHLESQRQLRISAIAIEGLLLTGGLEPPGSP